MKTNQLFHEDYVGIILSSEEKRESEKIEEKEYKAKQMRFHSSTPRLSLRNPCITLTLIPTEKGGKMKNIGSASARSHGL